MNESRDIGPEAESIANTTVIAMVVALGLFWSVPCVTLADDTRPVALSGSVSASDGRAMTNLVVYLRHGPESAYEYTSMKVDEVGEFRFDELKPGLIVVAAFAEGLSVAGQSRVMLQPGQRVTNVDLALSEAEPLKVTVVDSANRPVGGAKLSQLMWRTAEATPVWLTEPFLRRLTFALPVADDHGLLTVPWVPRNAKCSIRVSHSDFATAETPLTSSSKEASPLLLHRGKPLTVRVIDADTGVGGEGAIVSVMDAGLSPFEQSERQVDDKGEYRMRIATGRRVVVQVTHPRLAPARSVFVWKDQPTTVEVPLYRRALLQGHVVDPDGKPAANIRITFSIRSPSSLFSSGAVTDENGNYRIDAREGEGTVSAANGRGYFYDGKAIPIHLRAGGTATLTDIIVHPIPPIGGIAMNPDGSPLSNALISDQSLPYGGQQTLADSEGRFELPLVSLPRLATLIIVRHPTQPMSGGLVIPYGDVRKGREFRVTVQPEATLVGRVATSDPDAHAAADVRVAIDMLVDMGKRKYMLPVASTTTDKTGRFRFKGLSRHTRYHVTTSRQSTRKIPEDLIELQQDVVELSVPLRAEPSNSVAVVSTTSQTPPPLACDDWINSSPLSLSELTGKVVLIDFWATWCGPCVAELPKLQLAHRLYADKGLIIIGLHDNSASKADVRSFIERRKITFPIALDNARGHTVGRYKVTQWPTKVLIDRHGNLSTFRDDDDLLTVLRAKLLYETD